MENDIQRYGRIFGMGTYSMGESTPRHPTNRGIDRVYEAAWANGCPVPTRLIQERGVASMLERYKDVNLWFGYILDTSYMRNWNIYRELSSFQNRRADEHPQIYEVSSIPERHYTQLAPMVALPGYAIPRVIAEVFKSEQALWNKPCDDEEYTGAVSSPFTQFLDRIEKPGNLGYNGYIRRAKNGLELLAMIANDAVTIPDVSPVSILRQCFSQGILDEENYETTFRIFISDVIHYGRNLLHAYKEIPQEEREKAGIIDIAKLRRTHLKQKKPLSWGFSVKPATTG